MKTNLFKVFSLTAILAFFSVSFIQAQINGSGLSKIQPNLVGEEQINQITKEAGDKFKLGLMELEIAGTPEHRKKARYKFDEAVEVFLLSNINTKISPKLEACLNHQDFGLIETINRIEYPDKKRQPNINSLAIACGWKLESKLIDNVANIIKYSTESTTASNNGVNDLGNKGQLGLLTQEQPKIPDDELAQLPPETTQEDANQIESNPEIQQQFIKVEQAIANKSFGFSFRLHPFVQQYIGYYRGRGRQTMEIGLYRSGMFTRMARRIFREEGVPENIVWLGQVESAWKPTARSWAAAAGLWQFIPGTGSRYNLRINGYMDERNSFEKATRASAQYLKFLATRYGGNWELGMAAYNCGEGNVDRAIRRAGVADFWAAYPYLPKETRNYVPNILAVILIANNPNAYGFGHVRPAPQLDYEILRVPPSTSLTTIAQLSDTSVDYIRYLNPEFRTNMTPPEPYMVRVPQGRGNAVAAVLRKTSVVQGGNNVAVARVMAGETQQELANRTGGSQVAVVSGNKAVVRQNGNNVKTIGYSYPSNTPTPTAPTTKGLQIVKAKEGDTIAKIAARFGIAPATLANLNGMTSIDTPLKAGREIRVQAR